MRALMIGAAQNVTLTTMLLSLAAIALTGMANDYTWMSVLVSIAGISAAALLALVVIDYRSS